MEYDTNKIYVNNNSNNKMTTIITSKIRIKPKKEKIIKNKC